MYEKHERVVDTFFFSGARKKFKHIIIHYFPKMLGITTKFNYVFEIFCINFHEKEITFFQRVKLRHFLDLVSNPLMSSGLFHFLPSASEIRFENFIKSLTDEICEN